MMSRITLNLKKFSRPEEQTGNIQTLSWAVASRMVPRFLKGSSRNNGEGYDTYGCGATTTRTTASGRRGVLDAELVSTAVDPTDAMESTTKTIGNGKVLLDEEEEYNGSNRSDEDDDTDTLDPFKA
ncbi:hypothetical protein PM082_022116 [Marasmius tenuissimus]|nr:hypothetical protein PM082_022116 [Marasmius tenuissimus]